jgi:hypothetical protein
MGSIQQKSMKTLNRLHGQAKLIAVIFPVLSEYLPNLKQLSRSYRTIVILLGVTHEAK